MTVPSAEAEETIQPAKVLGFICETWLRFVQILA